MQLQSHRLDQESLLVKPMLGAHLVSLKVYLYSLISNALSSLNTYDLVEASIQTDSLQQHSSFQDYSPYL